MLAAGQTAIALSILWIWIFVFSLIGLKKIRRKPADSKAQQKKRKRWYRIRVPSYREIPRRAKTMVKSGRWLAISATFGICAAIAGLTVFKLGKGSSTLPGGGFYRKSSTSLTYNMTLTTTSLHGQYALSCLSLPCKP